MRNRLVLRGLAVLLACPPLALAQWTGVGTGIEYQEFRTSHPNDVYVARMLRSETNAYIESSIAQGKISGAREVVSSQATRNDDAIGYWGQTWGNRNDVVIAVNGSFFDLNTGVATGGVIHSGWYCKRYDNVGGSGFDWTLNRTLFIGGCVTHYSWKQLITYVTDGNVTQEFQGINVAPADGQITIFTPQYNSTTLTDNTVSEVVVELTRPMLLMPTPAMVQGTVKQVRQNAGSTQLPFDCVVLSAKGSAATTMLSYAHVGDTIGISQEIHTFLDDCATPMGVDWTKSYGTVGGNFVFLEGGVIQPTDDPGMTARNPRTAVGYNANYVFFLVCDGRSAQSVGMTSNEMGAFFRDTLGATDAVNLDGGGSSTMWVNGTVMNVPSDGSERTVSNGMLMCNLVAKAQSTTFATGNVVTTTGSASCRLGPGTDYTSIATIASGTQGTIVENALKGVYAKGYYWLKVDFSGTVGWVAETLLSGGGCTPPGITQQPTNQTVATGGTAIFSVTASGTAPLSYQWQKNQANVTNGGHYSGCTTATLTVSNCDSNDAANYRCVVTNACGNATSNEASLTVNPPVSTFIVESRSGGQNYASYSESGSWSNSSAKSTASGCTSGIGSRYAIIGTTAGKGIFSYTPSSSGTYEVFTTNCNTTNSGNPLIHRVFHSGGSTNVSVCQNSTCGSNAVNKWYSLGQYNLNGGTAYKVELDIATGAGSAPSGNAARSDAIKWVFIGGGGCTPPAITQQPTNQSVPAGGTAVFSVTASGTTPLSYQWQKNQANVTNGGHYSGCTTATLTISSCDSNDAANYRCVVTNACGNATSNEASLTVTTVQTIINDNFDSYADQAAFQAVWPTPSTSLVLSTAAYYSSPKSVYSASGSTARSNKRTFSETIGTDSSPITLTFRFYDSGSTGTSNQWVELRDYAPSAKQLIQFGVYGGCSLTYYSARVAYSPGNGWAATSVARSVGWHLFKVVIKSTTMDFYVDNVLCSANRAYASSQGSVSWEECRVGSGYASASLAASYDDVVLTKGQ